MPTPRILIVDDDRALIDAVAMGLRRMGYRVSACRDGMEAASQVRASRYDAVVMDVQMPGNSGLDTQATLTDLGDLGDCPVIYITGDTSDETRERCEALGARAILYKPFDTDDLAAAIDDAVGPAGRFAA